MGFMNTGWGWLKAAAMGPALRLKLSLSTSEKDRIRTNRANRSAIKSAKVINQAGAPFRLDLVLSAMA